MYLWLDAINICWLQASSKPSNLLCAMPPGVDEARAAGTEWAVEAKGDQWTVDLVAGDSGWSNRQVLLRTTLCLFFFNEALEH